MARWIDDNHRPKSWQFKCSECGEIAYYPQGNHEKYPSGKKCGYKYCPNCGVKMADRKTEPQYNAEEFAKDINRKVEMGKKEWNARHIDEFFREPTAEERKAVADYIDSISVPTGVNVFDLMDEPTSSKMEQVEDEPQTDCAWK